MKEGGMMRLRKLICVFIVFQLGLSLNFAIPQTSIAFDAKTTHRGIDYEHPGLTMKAIDLKLKEHNPNDPNAPAPDREFYETFSDSDNRKLIEQGSEEEDYPEKELPTWVKLLPGYGTSPPGSVISEIWKTLPWPDKRSEPWTTPRESYQLTPFLTHFYNPKTGTGLFSLPNSKAPDVAEKYLEEAADYYVGYRCHPPHPMKAFYVLGRAFCGLGFGLGFALAYSLVLKGRISLPLCSTIIAAAFRTSLLTASLTCASHPIHEGLKNLTCLKCFDFFSKPFYNFLIPLSG
jgi:hypothetical protein